MQNLVPRPCKQCGITFQRVRRVQQFCSVECQFWSKVPELSVDECWPWQGTLNSEGYGIISYDYRTLLAHRVSHEIHHGPLKGLCALHRCDNPPCVNPAHLWSGTLADNVRDRNAKGRGRWVNNGVRGSKNHLAKVLEADVIEIRRSALEGAKQADLARIYGLTRGGIWRIVARKCWRHI